MKLINSIQRIFLQSFVLLFAVCSLVFVQPSAIADAVNVGATQEYIAVDTVAQAVAAVDSKVAEIEEEISFYRDQKEGIAYSKTLSLSAKKRILKEINSEINALIKERDALLNK